MNNEQLEEKLAELRQKYRDLLGEGRTEDATEVYREAERLKAEHRGESEEKEEEVEPEPESESVDEAEDEGGSSVEAFEDIKGVGEELAQVLRDRFGSVEEMANASVEDLEPVPGIGEKKGESLLDQLN